MKVLSLLLFLFLSSASFASTTSTSSIILKNGLKVITSYNNSSDVVSITMISKTGLLQENEKNCGITSMVQNLLFEGTKKRTYHQIQKDIQETGTKIESKVELDNSYVAFTTHRKHFPKMLDIALDIIFNPLFPDVGIKKQKEILINRTKTKNINPVEDSYWLLMKKFYKKEHLAFGDYPPENIISNIHKEEIFKWHKKMYSPDNVVISISGNFIPQNAISKIKEFENVPSSDISFFYDEEKISQDHKTIISKDIDLSIVMIMFEREKSSASDHFLLQTLSQIMSNTKSDIIHNIKEKLSIAHNIDVKFTNDGIIIYAICSPKNIEKIKSAIFWEIAKIKQKEFDDLLLQEAKEYLLNDYYIDMQKNVLKSYCLGIAEVLNIGYNIQEQYPDVIKNITGKQIKEIAQKNLKDYHIVIVSPDNM